MGKVVQFFKDIKAELEKVSWSKPQDLVKATVVVLVGTTFLTGFILLVDTALSGLLSVLIK